MPHIPIVVLTGFLGSGKTSLLNALLKDPAFKDSAVVVNEFGEIGLDHLLVASAKDNIILLDAGCLCCTMLDSLKETLIDLYYRRVKGQVPEFARILIETTGLADPAPILQTITRDPVVSHFYRLQGLICTVDALFGGDQLKEHAEAGVQIALADRLIVTKTDLTGGACPAELCAKLQSLNPLAGIHIAVHGNTSINSLLALDHKARNTPPWLGDIYEPENSHHHTHAGPHDDAIGSESFWLDRPVTWSGIAAWTEWMKGQFGREVLRCKCMINVADSSGPVVVHGVRGLFTTERLPVWPDAERRSRLVIIGRGLDRKRLTAGLGWLYVAEGTQPPNPTDEPPAIAAQ
jgi:G3E family GTPase